MRTRLAKEAWSLRPAWAAALLLAAVPRLLFPGVDRFGVWLSFFFLGCVIVGVEVFGREFTQGTFPLLLAQPLARARLWREKLAVLTLVLASVWLVHEGAGMLNDLVRPEAAVAFGDARGVELGRSSLLMGALRVLGEHPGFGFHQLLASPVSWGAPVAAVAAAGGGVLFALLLRQVGAAFWMTLLVPVALGVFGSMGLEALGGRALGLSWWGWGVAGYGLAALGVARWWFLRFEDLEPLNREVSLPWPRRARGGKRRATERLAVPGLRRALWRKELRLQQINYVFAAVFLLLTVAVFWRVGDDLRGGLNDVWVNWMVGWSLLPVMIGAVAVAEERRLGVFEWQQTLPASRRHQWRWKLGTAGVLAAVLGVVLPTAVEVGLFFAFGAWDWAWLMALPWRLLLAAIGLGLGLYASTLARNLIQTLTLLVGLVGVLGLSLGGWAATLHAWRREAAGPGPADPWNLVLAWTPLVLLPLLWSLAFRNYRAGQVDGRVWRRNLGALALAMGAIGLLSAGTYARCWEVLMPEERASGPALTKRREPKVLDALGRRIVLTPDGKLWIHGPGIAAGTVGAPGVSVLEALLAPRCLEPEAEWVDVAASEFTIAAVRRDGTLWSWGYRLTRGGEAQGQVLSPEATQRRYAMRGVLALPTPRASTGEVQAAAPPPLPTNVMVRTGTVSGASFGRLPDSAATNYVVNVVDASRQPWPIGTASNWTSVALGLYHGLALRADGSLWAWGLNKSGEVGDGTTEPRLDPVRIDSGTNWTRIAAAAWASAAARADGSVWVWGSGHGAAPAPAAEGRPARSLSLTDFFLCWIEDDGTVRVQPRHGTKQSRGWAETRLPGTALTRAAVGWPGGVGLEADGTMWRWTWGRREEGGLYALAAGPLEPVGTRRDWVAVARAFDDSVLALAADGTLWRWQPARGDPSFAREFIPPTRRPQRVARFTLGP